MSRKSGERIRELLPTDLNIGPHLNTLIDAIGNAVDEAVTLQELVCRADTTRLDKLMNLAGDLVDLRLRAQDLGLPDVCEAIGTATRKVDAEVRLERVRGGEDLA